MDSLNERLKNAYNYLLSKGVVHSRVQFATALGKSETQISLAFKDAPKRCTMGLMRSIAKEFSGYLEEKYLLTGEGKMEKPDPGLRPHYPAKVSAGFLGNADIVTESDVKMIPKIAHIGGEYDFTISVEGNSMEPIYYEGDTLACRKLERGDPLVEGKIYVIDSRDGAVVKTYVSQTNNSIRLHSENPEYRNFSIDKSEILGIAEVVGFVDANPELRQKRLRQCLIDYAEKVIMERIQNMDKSEKTMDHIKGMLKNL